MSNFGLVSAGRGPIELPLRELPGLVPGIRLLAQTAEVVLAVGPIEVYSNCLMLTFRGLLRPGSSAADPEEMQHLFRQLVEGVGPTFSASSAAQKLPLETSGGGSHNTTWRLTFLAGPVPTADLHLSATWPAHDLVGSVVVPHADLQAARAAVQRFD